jgi:hypothetical protein
VVALNPGVPSLRYALLWLGIVAVARGVALALAGSGLMIDIVLALLCLLGMEIGGLLILPSVLAFALADASGRQPAPT